MKLSKRFLLLPLVFAAFSYLFYSAYKEVRNKTLNEFNKQQFTLARQASRGIESFFIYYQRELTFLSNLDYVANLNDQGKKLLADFYNNHSDQINAITIVDSKGILQYTYPLNNSVMGKDISDQSHVKSVIESHKPVVSDVFTSVQGFRAIAYHVPIIIGNEYKGSIAILIPIDNLGKRFVENIRTGETGYGWMISETGVVLFDPKNEHTGSIASESYKNSPSVLKMLGLTAQNKELTLVCDINRVKTLTATYRVSLGNTFWTIIVFSPEREIYATLTSFRNKLYLLVLLTVIVIGIYFHLSIKANDILKEEKKRKVLEAERKRIEKELITAKEKAEESDRLKSAFLANMSHELRTPLNAIIGFSGMIIESGPDKNTLPFSKIILSSGQQLLTMVEDIFDSTMIETGQIKLNYEKTDINSLLNEVSDLMHAERTKEAKSQVGLRLNTNNSEGTDYLLTDSRKLKQVLVNLLRNALKFTDKGYIEFGYEKKNDTENKYFQFYVKDTGIGIDKSYHDAIFNIFRQIDDTHTRKFGGMGIGLSIAKKTVELMGGKIWVESEYAKGSVFYFTIPVTKEGFTENELKTMTQVKSFSGKTVLVAEDERSNYDFLCILLTRMNINVLWAKNGKEAVNLCETDPSIDLVFMDIKMPFLNGLEATREIKLKRPLLPIIAQSAYAMNSDKQEAEDAGCDGYLTKPIKISDINGIIESYLS